MDLDEAKEVAEDFFADYEGDDEDIALSIAKISTDGDSLLIKMTFDADEFDEGELSRRGVNAANAVVDKFRAEYPEYEDLSIELDFAIAR